MLRNKFLNTNYIFCVLKIVQKAYMKKQIHRSLLIIYMAWFLSKTRHESEP